MLKNKKIVKFVYLLMASSLIVAPLTACSTTNIDQNIPEIENPSIPDNDSGTELPIIPENPNPDLGYDPNQKIGTIDDEILINTQIDINNVNKIETNSYGLTENYIEYENANDFSEFVGFGNKLLNDISNFVYQTWLKNSKNINITNLVINNADFKTQIKFYDIVNFNFSFEVIAFKTNTNFVIANKTYILNQGQRMKINVNVNDTQILPSISTQSESFYLGWKVENAQFSVEKDVFVSTLAPSINNVSHVFPFILTNLTKKMGTHEIFNNYQNEVVSRASNKSFSTSLQKNIEANFIKNIELVSSLSDVFKIIGDNPSISEFIKKITPSIMNFLVRLNIIPKELESLLIEILNSDRPIIDLISENKNKIINLMANHFPEFKEQISQLLNILKPGIVENSEEHQLIISYISFLPPKLVSIIEGDFLGITKPALNFSNFIFNNIIDLLDILFPNNNVSWFNLVKDLISIIFDQNNKNKNILNIIVEDSKTKQKIVDIITKSLNLPSDIANIVKILIVDNTAINVENLRKVFYEINKPISILFARKQNYNSFWDSFENIRFKRKYVKTPIVNKTTNTISTIYDIEFQVTKSTKFNTRILKDLISEQSVYEIIKSLGTDLVSMLPESTIPAIKDIILNFIPNEINLWTNQVKNDEWSRIRYVADSAKISPDAILKGSDYILGIQFPFELEFWFQDSALISSITSFYDAILSNIQLLDNIHIQIYYGMLWRKILSNLFLRSYRSCGLVSFGFDDEKIIGNIDTIDEQIYTRGYEFSVNENIITNQNIKKFWNTNKIEKITTYDSKLTSIINEQQWKNDSPYMKDFIYGEIPIMDDQIIKNIANAYYDFDKNISQEKYPITKVFPTFNFDLDIQFWIKINSTENIFSFRINVISYQSFIYTPFNYYNISTKTMTNRYIISKTFFEISENSGLIIPK